ncbi:MAG TPA: HAMP domain-containing sensor histidine kinase [Opitutaceae bacterium]|nr:HAMP domain-containing sensor histidine kinase [Opitutaceae bacterium]
MTPENNAPLFPANTPVRFRWRLQLTIMAVVSLITVGVLWMAHRRVAETVTRGLTREFQQTFASLHDVQEMRRAALVERCLELVERLGVSAGEDFRQRLYTHGVEVLGDTIEVDEDHEARERRQFHVEFVRFLDPDGRFIEPPAGAPVGMLTPGEEAQLTLHSFSGIAPQLGYLRREQQGEDGPILDIIALPMVNAQTGRVVAVLVLGFEPAEHVTETKPPAADALTGLWTQGQVYLLGLPPPEALRVTDVLARALAAGPVPARPIEVTIGGVPRLLLLECLNVDSAYPPAYEVGLYSLTKLQALQRQLRWQVLGAGGLVLLLAVGISRLMAVRFARPVAQLLQFSAENRARRREAEEALALTTEGLRRAARFSADASHQLKTPVAVLRAGLEELQAKERLSKHATREVRALIAQTSRLSSLIDDLLLLSRMDAGRLEIQFRAVDLVRLIEGVVDDQSVRPDPFGLQMRVELPPRLPVQGDARYLTLVVENLLENAVKYNRPGGVIRLHAVRREQWVELAVGNTARQPIPLADQPRIFDRFSRGNMGENIPGYGLGLNLARELARLHRGDLELRRSDEEWTEFLVRLVAAD